MTVTVLTELAQRVLDLVGTQAQVPTRVYVQFGPGDSALIDALPRALAALGLQGVGVSGRPGPRTALLAVEFPATDAGPQEAQAPQSKPRSS